MTRIRLPLRLESEANKREHWHFRAERVRAQRRLTKKTVKRRLRGRTKTPGAAWRVTITRIAPRKLDDDNCVRACKAVRDGVADAFGLDDRDERLLFVCEQRRGVAAGEYATLICIESRPRPQSAHGEPERMPTLEDRAIRSEEWIKLVTAYGVKVAAQKGMPIGREGAFNVGVLMLEAGIKWLRESGMPNARIAQYCRLASGEHEESAR